MNKARVLCEMNAYMMREFSDRTVAGLKRFKLFKFLLPPFQSFLEINLTKEIDKDREIIACAVEAAAQGLPPGANYTSRLLQRSREIDRNFLQQAHTLSSAIQINYDEIDRIRQRRIEQVLTAAYGVLVNWQGQARFRQVAAGLYSREQFRELLSEILALYISETQTLSQAVRIPRKLFHVRDSMLTNVHKVMEEVAAGLADELAGMVYKQQRKS